MAEEADGDAGGAVGEMDVFEAAMRLQRGVMMLQFAWERVRLLQRAKAFSQWRVAAVHERYRADGGRRYGGAGEDMLATEAAAPPAAAAAAADSPLVPTPAPAAVGVMEAGAGAAREEGRARGLTVRFGRDKILSLVRQRLLTSRRMAFDRWKLHARYRAKALELKRGQMRLQVNMHQVRSEREALANAHRHIRLLKIRLGAALCFYHWKTQVDAQRLWEEQESQRQERAQIAERLRELYQHMASSNRVESECFVAATLRGELVMRELVDVKQTLDQAVHHRASTE